MTATNGTTASVVQSADLPRRIHGIVLPVLVLTLFIAAWTSSSARAQTCYPGGINATLRLWLDANEPGTLFQDSLRTVPVTAANQPVGGWRDLSGNNHHLGAVTKPTLLEDGGGRRVLSFNGSAVLYRRTPVVTGTAFSAAFVMKSLFTTTASATADQRFVHVGPWVSSSTTGNALGLSARLLAVKQTNLNQADLMNINTNTVSYPSLLLRYSSDPGQANNSGNHPRTVPFRSVPTAGADPSAADLVDVGGDSLHIGLVTKSTANLASTNPVVTWNGSVLTAGGQTAGGVALTIPDASANQGGNTAIGGGFSGSGIADGFTGWVSVVLLYSQQLSMAKQTILANYLNAHLEPTRSLRSRDFFAQDATFRRTLVGVGKAGAGDTASFTFSTSAGLGFDPTNLAGASDDSYLMIAHNGGDSLAGTMTHTVAGVGAVYRMNRVWKLERSGFTGGTMPASVAMSFDLRDFFGQQAVGAGASPSTLEGASYYLLRSASPDMSDPVIVDSVTYGTARVLRLTFSVPGASLTGGYYTVGSLGDDALFPLTFTGAVSLPASIDGVVELGSGGSTTVTSSKTVKGTLTLSGGSLTLQGSTLTVEGTLKHNSGTITLSGCSKIIIKTGRMYQKGGGSVSIPVPSDTACAGIEYEVDATLAYTGSSGNSAMGPEWPWRYAPGRVRMTGNNTITLTDHRTIDIEARFQNGILELNGKTLRLKGFSSRENGRIRGGATSRIIIDGVTQRFTLPGILDGLHTLRIEQTPGSPWSSPDPTVELNSSVVIHEDLDLAHGTLEIAGASNAPNVLTLLGGMTRSSGTLGGGPHSSLTVSEAVAGSRARMVLPAIVDGLRELTVDRANGAQLGSHLGVSSAVTLSVSNRFGTLDLGNRTLTLGPAASISGETSVNRITGTVAELNACGAITTTRTVAAQSTEAFGNIGVTITTGSTQPGAVTVTRNCTQWVSGGEQFRKSIQRSYTITPAVNSGLNATLVFHYHDDERDGLSEGALQLLRKHPQTGDWEVKSAASHDTGLNTFTLTGIDAFSEWSAGDPITVFPVELISFSGLERNGVVRLFWRTATETNNYGFDIERRTGDAKQGVAPGLADWRRIGFVAGSGTTSSERRYSFTDPLTGVPASVQPLSYRLRQIDRDGTTKHSPVVVVQRTGAAQPAGAAQPVPALAAPHPNPAATGSGAMLVLPEAATVTVRLYSMDGRMLATLLEGRQLEAGSHTVAIPRPGDGTGTCFVVATVGSQRLVRAVTFLR